jgi:hypothetical protein
MARKVHFTISIVLLVFFLLGAFLTGIANDHTEPKNILMFWFGISFFILFGLSGICWAGICCYEDDISGCNTFGKMCFHLTMLQMGLIFMIVGSIIQSHSGGSDGDPILYWTSVGFLTAWPVSWILWFLISVYKSYV